MSLCCPLLLKRFTLWPHQTRLCLLLDENYCRISSILNTMFTFSSKPCPRGVINLTVWQGQYLVSRLPAKQPKLCTVFIDLSIIQIWMLSGYERGAKQCPHSKWKNMKRLEPSSKGHAFIPSPSVEPHLVQVIIYTTSTMSSEINGFKKPLAVMSIFKHFL